MESRSPTYNSWQAMKKRCLNKKHKGYKDYGEKGITICDEWIDSYQNFKKDIGEKPENHSLDRIDNSIGYSKENCKWSTITIKFQRKPTHFGRWMNLVNFKINIFGSLK